MCAWQERKPTASDIPNAELASLITTNKSSISSYLGQHYYWTQSSGLSAGIPILSDGSAGPGGARAWLMPSSAMSVHAPLGTGSLILTSDTSRLIVVTPSGNSMLVGSHNAIVVNGPAGPTINAGCRWLVQSGTTFSQGIGSIQTGRQDFPTAYGDTPTVIVQAYSDPTSSGATNNYINVNMYAVNKSGFSFAAIGAAGSGNTFWVVWRSEGSVTI